MKTATKVIIGLAVVSGVVLAFAPGRLMKAATLRLLARSTGFELSYDKLSGNPWQRTIDIEGLRFLNPPDFPDTEAIEVAHLHAKFQWKDLLGEGVRLDELRLDIPRVVVVSKADGETNMERIQRRGGKAEAPSGAEAAGEPPPPPHEEPAAEPPASAPAAEAPAGAAKPKAPEVSIGLLHLKLGRIEMRDYGRMRNGKPRSEEYELNIESTYHNVTDLDALGQQLAMQTLIQGGIRALGEQLKDPETQKKLQKNLNNLADELGKHLGGLLQ